MTQLVQLQQILPALRAAGFEPFAISNDTVARLADFARQHAISYSLLADEDSAVIRDFGILNTLIQPDEGAHMRWYGIPYPGTYVTDTAGVVVDKDFHQHHARRMSGQMLLHRVLGTVPDPVPDAPIATAIGPEVTLTAYLADSSLRLEVITNLVCQLEIASGLHVYAEGAPEAFTPVSFEFAGLGVRFGQPSWPVSHPLEFLDTTIPVYEGSVSISVPVTVTSELVRLGHGIEHESAELTVTCHYQACDDSACGLPSTVTATIKVPLETLVEPDGIRVYVERVRQGEAEAAREHKENPSDEDDRKPG